MRIFVGKGFVNKLRKSLPETEENFWMSGAPVYIHMAYPYINDDGDTIWGCIFKDNGRTVLLVDKAIPFTTA
jgi:hypothetical protein